MHRCTVLLTGLRLALPITGWPLSAWNSGTAYATEIGRTSNADGTQTVVTRGNMPIANAIRQLMRLSVSLSNN